MKSSKRLWLCLVCVTLFVISEAQPDPTNSRPPTNNLPPKPSTHLQSQASLELCKTHKSPAENCFDYLKLAISWAPGCVYADPQIKRKLNPKKQLDNKWTIHGLWPAWYQYKDKELLETRCRDTRNSKIRYTLEQGTELVDDLKKYWSVHGNIEHNFLRNEFYKHGLCATRSPVFKTRVSEVEHDYFQKTLTEFKRLKSKTKAFEPFTSSKTKLKDIIEHFKTELKVKVDVTYSQENYLTEVRICYNIKLELIDCPRSVPNAFELNKDILVTADEISKNEEEKSRIEKEKSQNENKKSKTEEENLKIKRKNLDPKKKSTKVKEKPNNEVENTKKEKKSKTEEENPNIIKKQKPNNRVKLTKVEEKPQNEVENTKKEKKSKTKEENPKIIKNKRKPNNRVKITKVEEKPKNKETKYEKKSKTENKKKNKVIKKPENNEENTKKKKKISTKETKQKGWFPCVLKEYCNIL